MLTAEYLRSIIDYDPETGIFRWKAASASIGGMWGGGYPGSIAGCQGSDGYWVISVSCHNYLAHRLAWLWVVGDFPAMAIDHIDRDRSNNRWVNLREATRSQNSLNRRPRRTRAERERDRKILLAKRMKENPEFYRQALVFQI